MSHTEGMGHPARAATLLGEDRRVSVRQACLMEATSQPLEDVELIAWGAVVENISVTGIGIALCYPFRPGTYLAVDLQAADGSPRTVLVRVVHVRDRFDGAWYLGCEFVKPLTDSDVELLI